MSKVFIKKFYKNKAVRYRITIPETNMEWNLDRQTYHNLKRAIFGSIVEEYPQIKPILLEGKDE